MNHFFLATICFSLSACSAISLAGQSSQSTKAVEQSTDIHVLAAPAATPGTPQTDNTTITFSEFAVGTSISNQYQKLGIIFGGDAPFINPDGSNPTSPVLSGSPLFNGNIEGRFVDPSDGKPVTVKEFELDAGYFDDLNSTELSWYDNKKLVLGRLRNSQIGIQRFVIKSKTGIAYWRITILGTEPAGYAIDNVSFNRPSGTCGDERDDIIKEYSAYKIAFTPTCDNFTQSAHSAHYSFAALNTGDYSWALIRQPLVLPASAGYGLETWVSYIGSIHRITSAYRNPARNASVGGAAASRHLFGDAVDLQNISRTVAEHDELAAAASSADADYIEPTTLACHLGCVHADWRYHPGPYVQ